MPSRSVVAVRPRPSVAVKVALHVPRSVGFPEMVPPVVMSRPGGSDPEAIRHV